jgi:tetratricopeptide (TPR) repeat protein
VTSSQSTSDDPRLAAPIDLENALAKERVRGALFGEVPAPITIDRFTILARIGAGGMSTVYAAYDPRLDRKIALKLLRAGDDDSTHASHARQARLLREARAMARLSHPHVATVHDVGLVDPDGEAAQVWIAMEFIDGEPLGKWCSRARPRVTEILDVYVQAGRGLAAAHAAGLVHRDFKPDNVMRDGAARVRVLDFGLARAVEDVAASHERGAATHDKVAGLANGTVTTTGAIVGTPAYMAPELFAGGVADARSDQFSFCAALYEALWGERPFAGTSLAAIVAAFDRAAPSPARRRDVTTAVRAAVLRGLARDPAARWPTMEDLLRELGGPRGRTTRVVGAAIAIATVVGAFGIAATHEPACAGVDAAVDAAWNDDARAAVHAAIVAVDVPHATDVSERVRERLDVYATELGTAYRSACADARVTGAHDEDVLAHRTACLDRRQLDLAALVDVLRDADAPMIDRAVQATSGLGAIDRCLDPEVPVAVRLRADAEDAATAREVDELLSRTFASNMAGRYPEARTHAEAAVARAEPLGDLRLRAEAQAALGWALEQLGDDAEAYRHLADAHYLADATGQNHLAAETASRLLSCIASDTSKREELELWRKNAQAAIDRIPDGELPQATLDAAMGFALQRRGELADARIAYERALEIRQRRAHHANHGSAMVTGLQTQLAGVLVNLGEREAAMALVDEAIATAADDLGATHPHRGQMLINATGVHVQAGDLAGAERLGREAIAILEPSVGHDHPNIANVLSNLGGALCMQQRIAECADALADAVGIFERLGTRDLPWANATDNYANALAQLGRHDDAIARVRIAHAWYVDRLGADSPQTGSHFVTLGKLFAKAGRTAEAREQLDRALAIAELHGDTKLEARARGALADARE